MILQVRQVKEAIEAAKRDLNDLFIEILKKFISTLKVLSFVTVDMILVVIRFQKEKSTLAEDRFWWYITFGRFKEVLRRYAVEIKPDINEIRNALFKDVDERLMLAYEEAVQIVGKRYRA